jgi:hypothetical protein
MIHFWLMLFSAAQQQETYCGSLPDEGDGTKGCAMKTMSALPKSHSGE